MRLVGENIEQGVYSIDQARKMAQEQNLDLVEISPTATPPVCRVIDYSKFKYEQKKKTRELKAKQTKVVLKEIRFGPNTDEHDFAFKVKHAQEFLREGAKIKSYVHFVGRSIVFKERGEILLLKLCPGPRGPGQSRAAAQARRQAHVPLPGAQSGGGSRSRLPSPPLPTEKDKQKKAPKPAEAKAEGTAL